MFLFIIVTIFIITTVIVATTSATPIIFYDMTSSAFRTWYFGMNYIFSTIFFIIFHQKNLSLFNLTDSAYKNNISHTNNKSVKKQNSLVKTRLLCSGAGRGNRTPILSLEGWHNSHYTIPACANASAGKPAYTLADIYYQLIKKSKSCQLTSY